MATKLEYDMPEEVAERITEAFCARHDGGEKRYNVRLIDIHEHNACNHTMTGIVVVDGVDYGFVMESGDWAGTVVKEYAPAEECTKVYSYEPPPETRFKLVPKNYDELKAFNPQKLALAMKWIQQTHIQEKLSNYHYDRHFQPGFAIENYYKTWADGLGLKLVVDSPERP
jgi:hypothetical protein